MQVEIKSFERGQVFLASKKIVRIYKTDFASGRKYKNREPHSRVDF